METHKFIYVLKLLPEYQNKNNWTEETNKIISTHFNYLKKLKEDGQIILVGKTDYSADNPSNFGIVIFSATDPESAERFMNNDPAIQQKVMTSELHPFSHAL
ncbi:MAG: hypothetical protein JWN78_2843 [Bacteroidota bacterium]|nr:hypothetical protein [Bacteroidota bacterium]